MISAQALIYGVLFISLYFEVFLLISFFENKEVRKKKNTSFFPTVAVIVPCWNEEKTVSHTLKSLLALKYPKSKLEIIAVNDGSTDKTLTVLRTFENNHQVTILNKNNGGKHSAMNEALKYTDAEFVGCLDADSFVEPDALANIVVHFKDENISAVTPSIKIYNANSILQIVQKAEYGLAIFIRKTFTLIDALFITPGPFSFFRKSVLDEVGPWRHAYGTEDLEMCLRLQFNHKKVTNEPSAIVYTTAPKTLKQLFHQRVRWTYGFLKNASIYRRMFFNPKYGTLGMFILPISLLSLFSALFLFSIMFWNLMIFIINEIIKFKTVGISAPTTKFDLFFVHTSSVVILTLVLIALTIILMGIGKKMAKDSFLSFDILFYLALYGFITPLWLTVSIYKAITSKTVKWR